VDQLVQEKQSNKYHATHRLAESTATGELGLRTAHALLHVVEESEAVPVNVTALLHLTEVLHVLEPPAKLSAATHKHARHHVNKLLPHKHLVDAVEVKLLPL